MTTIPCCSSIRMHMLTWALMQSSSCLHANGRAAGQPAARATIYRKDKFGKDETCWVFGKKQLVRISMEYGAARAYWCISTACMWYLPAGSMDDLMAGWMSVAWIFQTAAILCAASKANQSACHRRAQNHAPIQDLCHLRAPCRRWIFFATHNMHRSKDPCRLHAPSLNILRLSPHYMYVRTTWEHRRRSTTTTYVVHVRLGSIPIASDRTAGCFYIYGDDDEWPLNALLHRRRRSRRGQQHRLWGLPRDVRSSPLLVRHDLANNNCL